MTDNLLEPSSNDSDGGRLVGRDPREISAPEFQGAEIFGAPLLRVIRDKCSDCCCGNVAEVRKCVATKCALWPYRMGANPFRRVSMTDEKRAILAERFSKARAARS